MEMNETTDILAQQQQQQRRHTILNKLRELESQNQDGTSQSNSSNSSTMRVILAVEAGSRANGLATPNSDHDVRFLFVYDPDWYLVVDEDLRDEIRFCCQVPLLNSPSSPLTELDSSSSSDGNGDHNQHVEQGDITIDFVGWELRKALRLLRRSNPPLIEWLHTPPQHVYLECSAIVGRLRSLATRYFAPATLAFHYRDTAKQNYVDYIRGHATCHRKRYLFIVRNYLAAIYIREHLESDSPLPPLEFEEILRVMNRVPEYASADWQQLIQQKKVRDSWPLEPRIPSLDQWIGKLREEATIATDYLRAQPRTPLAEWSDLNSLFQFAVKLVPSLPPIPADS